MADDHLFKRRLGGGVLLLESHEFILLVRKLGLYLANVIDFEGFRTATFRGRPHLCAQGEDFKLKFALVKEIVAVHAKDVLAGSDRRALSRRPVIQRVKERKVTRLEFAQFHRVHRFIVETLSPRKVKSGVRALWLYRVKLCAHLLQRQLQPFPRHTVTLGEMQQLKLISRRRHDAHDHARSGVFLRQATSKQPNLPLFHVFAHLAPNLRRGDRHRPTSHRLQHFHRHRRLDVHPEARYHRSHERVRESRFANVNLRVENICLIDPIHAVRVVLGPLRRIAQNLIRHAHALKVGRVASILIRVVLEREFSVLRFNLSRIRRLLHLERFVKVKLGRRRRARFRHFGGVFSRVSRLVKNLRAVVW